MTTLKKIITNKYLWITVITVGFFFWANQYIHQTSIVKQEVVAAKLKFTKDLYGVDFPSSDMGWIVGEDGLIAHTADQGGTWKIQKSRVTANLAAVNFRNTQKGFVVGAGGTLLTTADGGGTWEKETTLTDAFLSDICFATTDNGFIVGESGTLLSTKDAGKTWHHDKSLFKDALPWLIPELKSICFSTPENGWIVGEFGKVLKTVDGGLSWNIVDMGTDNTLFEVCFFDQNNGYIVGLRGLILVTENGGQSWFRDETFKRKGTLFCVAYRDHKARTPVFMAGKGEMIVKPNENTRFISQMIDGFDIRYGWLYDIDFVYERQAYAVGESGLILYVSRGEGDVWEKLDYNLLKG